MDFTYEKYETLISAIIASGYNISSFYEYITNPSEESKTVILRHDVESRYSNALKIARILSTYEVQGSFYFRISRSYDYKDVIHKIADLHHEIGYHYDDLSTMEGDIHKAIKRFEGNLKYLRNFAQVNTITMEGAPLSKYDNRDLWKEYSYNDYGIIGEPYFDLDFNKVLYLTDTGRNWDGHKYVVRDKPFHGIKNNTFIGLRYQKTDDIINAVQNNEFPDLAMLTFHPQRWCDKPFPWLKELVWQNIKNQGKIILPLLRKY